MLKATHPTSTRPLLKKVSLFLFWSLLINAGFTTVTYATQVADVTLVEGSIRATPLIPGATFMSLRVAGPQGLILFEQTSSGDPITWYPPEGVQDGIYTYEVRVGVVTKQGERIESRQTGPPVRRLIQSGSLSIRDGAIVSPSEQEEASLGNHITSAAKMIFATFMDFMVPPASADVLHYDDVIVTGSHCVGFDCANGESFGYDTIKLKENNLRFYFEDTSAGSFPANDWRIVINDTTSGGASYFAIEDASMGTKPFRIEAGAPNASLYIEDYGRVGLGTSIPYVELHIVDADSPTVRLDQDGSGGWSPQAWDLAGNETNFFIRDVTNGSKLPFRIQPNTPSSTLNLKSDGKVGIGTWSPSAKVEIQTTGEHSEMMLNRTDGAASILLSTNDSFVIGSRTNHLMELVVNDSPRMIIDTGGKVGIGTLVPLERLHVEGNAYVSGGLELGSSRKLKENIQPLNEKEAMDALKSLRPVKFNYKINPAEESVGFIAEEVPDLVATESRKTLSTMDLVGVLTKVVQRQQITIEELYKKIADLEKLVFEQGSLSRQNEL